MEQHTNIEDNNDEKIPYVINHSFHDSSEEQKDKFTKVFIDRFSIDKGTMGQIKRMILHPSVNNIRIMPDCHRGKGCCIGFTSELTDKVVPNYIGGDIGCGIITYSLNKKLSDLNMSVVDIEKIIRDVTPMGTREFSINDENHIPVSDANINELCVKAYDEAYNFANMYGQKFKDSISHCLPDYSIEWFKNKCLQTQIDYNYVLKSIGSLGGGNHFIEVNSNKEGILYITIHTGSRGFGQAICSYHQNKINETKFIDYEELDDKKKKLMRKIKDAKALKMVMDDIKNNLVSSRHPDYLETNEAYEYYFDMIFAQKYAELNRRVILQRILDKLNLGKIVDDNIIESIHNYIDFNDFILRKGAISASKDKLCLISLNMRDGILLCKGKGNKDWNYSSAHGAGRLLTRTESENKITLEMFKNVMKDVYSTSVLNETIDESPFSYKDSEKIKKLISDSVEIIEQLYPVINVKAIS